MDKKDILKLAQADTSRGSEYEARESILSDILGYIVAISVGLILFIIEWLVNNYINISVITALMAGYGVQLIYKWKTFKQIRYIILGTIALFVSLIFLIIFIFVVL